MNEQIQPNAKLRMVQIVLHWAWDPIGVRGLDGAADEYDSYAPTVLAMLNGKASDQEVAGYLARVEDEMMGLQPNLGRNEDVAVMLRELRATLA